MSVKMAGFTYAQILPLVLALLLIFIIPMIMRRYGLESEDLIRMLFSGIRKQDYAKTASERKKEKKREPYQSNGRSADLKGLVSTLLIFVRRNQFGLVYPGTVSDGRNTAGLLALLVTKQEVIGFNCFGYGGTVTEGKNASGWNQHMNGADQKIPDPIAGNREQFAIVRRMMDDNGMNEIPLRVVAVFTAHTVTLSTRHPKEVFTTERLLEHLRECASEEEGGTLDPADVSRRLNEHVIRIKPGSSRRK